MQSTPSIKCHNTEQQGKSMSWYIPCGTWHKFLQQIPHPVRKLQEKQGNISSNDILVLTLVNVDQISYLIHMEIPWPIRLVKNTRKVSWLQHSITSRIFTRLIFQHSQIVPHIKPITTWLQYKGLSTTSPRLANWALCCSKRAAHTWNNSWWAYCINEMTKFIPPSCALSLISAILWPLTPNTSRQASQMQCQLIMM